MAANSLNIPATEPSTHKRTTARRILGSTFIWLMVAIVLLWTLFPFYWAFVNSIRDSKYNYGNYWIPFLQFPVTLSHWKEQLAIPELRQAMVNSTIISVCAATLSLILGTLAAYGIARFHFNRPTNGSLTTWFMSQRIAPPVIFVAPYFLILRQIGMIDTLRGLVLLNATFNLTFPIIILTQMFREIPRELEEAAQVDGASRWQIFSRIALPLVAPGVVVSWILCLAFSWNEFLFAYATTVKNRPMSVFLVGAEQTRGVDYQYVGTRSLLALIVPLVAALLVQRYIVRGLSLGAVKG